MNNQAAAKNIVWGKLPHKNIFFFFSGSYICIPD